MSKHDNALRKCAATLAAAAGAAICLSAPTAMATSGSFKDTNTNLSVVQTQGFWRLFGSKVRFYVFTSSTRIQIQKVPLTNGGASFLFNETAFPYVKLHNAGVTVSPGMAGTFSGFASISTNQSDKYIACTFLDGGVTRNAWIHIISSAPGGDSVTIHEWSYNDSLDGSGTIKTLSSAIVTKKLALTDGTVKLLWTNKNEDGVARYQIQAKDADGSWRAVDSDAAGDGRYSVKTAPADAYRLVVETIDGATEEVAFE